MKNYIKTAHDTLVALGFYLDHKDRETRTDRWIFTHPNAPGDVIRLNFRMSETAARAAVQKARVIVGLATSSDSKPKAKQNTRVKAERAERRRRAATARDAAEARRNAAQAERLAAQRRRQVGDLDRLMRGQEVATTGADLTGEWIAPDRLADELGVTDSSVRHAIANGSLDLYQVGSRQMLKVAEARAWATA